jgi:mannosyltransferase OCH1-like enzyme
MRDMTLIPKIIHQFWLRGQLPPRVKELRDQLLDLHPGWDCRLWTESDLPSLINEFEYGKFHEARFKVAVAKYEVMAHFGGLVVDCDVLVRTSFEPLLQGTDHFLVWQSMGLISTGVMACAPNHALAWALVRELPASCKLYDGERPELQVGGQFATRVVEERFPHAVVLSESAIPHPRLVQGPVDALGETPAYAVHLSGSLH